MATGRVLQFDQVRGYGFVAAEDGGEDIFLHASVFDGDPGELVPGMRVEFQIMEGDRGRKAYDAHAAVQAAVQAAPHQPSPQAQKFPSTQAPDVMKAADEEQMCDVLSPAEFSQELTEILLGVVPSLTGEQILRVRQDVVDFARKRGWVDA